MSNTTDTTTETETATVVHFLTDGLAYRVSESPYVAGLTSAVGVEVTVTDELRGLNTDAVGNCFWDLADDEEAQKRHWGGRVMFRPGRAPAELLERVAAERAREARLRRDADAQDARAYGVSRATYAASN